MRNPVLVPLILTSSWLLLATACVEDSAFLCASSEECGDGVCEATGYCSFEDSSCATGRRYGEYASTDFANECVDALAASDALAEIAPNNIFVGAERVDFQYDLSVAIGERDSGVDTLSVELPAAFGSPEVEELLVDGSSVGFTDQSEGSSLSVLLDHKLREDARLQLRFSCDAPMAADIVGKDFSSSIDDSSTDRPLQPVLEGDADGDPGDANRWSVTVSDGLPAVSSALAEISPRDVAIGTVDNLFSYELELEIAEGDSGVDQIAINVPDAFGEPRLDSVLVEGSAVEAVDQSSEHTLSVSLAERITSSATVSLLFLADGSAEEDTAGQAFRSTVSDSAMPLVAPTESVPKNATSWLVTTTAWAALSNLVAEISPNHLDAGDSGDFLYDLQIDIGESNTGVDRVALSLPAHLQLNSVNSVQVEGAALGFSDSIDGAQLEISLDDKVVSTSHLRIAFNAEVIACTNDESGPVLASADDTSSSYAAQSAIAGNADGDAGDQNSYQLRSSGTPRLFWADRATAKIQGGIDDGCAVEDLVSGLTDPRLVAVNLQAGKFYWADVDVGQIWRANLDGSGLEVVITGLSNPSGVAIDAAGGKLYWTDYGPDKIQRSNLDGSEIEDLVVQGPLPYGIELDLPAGKMYWADTTDGAIRRANLDGSSAETILTGISQAADIALADGKLYATAHGSGTIIRANKDGSAVMDLITGQDEPVGLAFDTVSNRLFWADSGSGTIRSSNPAGNDIQDLITGLSDPQGLVLGR